MTAKLTLEQSLAAQTSDLDVARTISIIAGVTADLSRRIGRGDLDQSLSAPLGVIVQGEMQKRLDVLAHDALIEALRQAPVATVLSEEAEAPILLDASQPLAVAFDPLDGSDNIGINGPIGTIFSLLPAVRGEPDASFLQPGHRQLAAGLVIYGAQTQMILTTGSGTQVFTLNRDVGKFVLTGSASVAAQATDFAINMSNYRHWDEAIRHFIDDCLDGEEGPAGRNYNMRWLGAVAGEAFRIALRGGLYLYPSDRRPGYRSGRLRLVYEANPIAFLMEQAGGVASDGVTRILDLEPQAPHQRCGLVFGSSEELRRLAGYMSRGSGGRSPLFGTRGLFRS